MLAFFFFFFNDTATTEIYTLSLHDALPISTSERLARVPDPRGVIDVSPYTTSTSSNGTPSASAAIWAKVVSIPWPWRSEEHTSELQSQSNLVCRLLLEKKKKTIKIPLTIPH